MAIVLEKLISVETAISDVVASLYPVFSVADELQDSVACAKMLDDYLHSVGRIGMLARAAGLDGVHESCFYFYQVLQALRQRNEVLQRDQLDLLEQWPFVISVDMNEPFSVESIESLLDYFRNELWPIELPEHVINDIYDAYRRQSLAAGPEAEPVIAAEDNGDVALTQQPAGEPDSAPDRAQTQWFDADLVSALEQELVQATNALFDDLGNADDTDDAIMAAFELCAERLDLMLMSFTGAGMNGLADVCALYQGGLRTLGERRKVLSLREGQILSAWPSLVFHYLEQPDSPDTVETLVDYLSTVPGTAPVTGDERTRLIESLQPVSFEEDLLETPEAAIEEADVEAGDDAADLYAQLEEDAETTPPGDSISELVQLVRMELVFVADEYSGALAGFAGEGDVEAHVTALNGHIETVERLCLATESMGLTGLSEVLAHIGSNVELVVSQGEVAGDEQLALLQRWPELVLAYLDGLHEGLGAQPLVDYLRMQHWPVAMAEAGIAGLLEQLQSPELISEDDCAEERQVRAEADDVSLALPEDINPQLIDSLLQELPGHTEDFNKAISRLVDGRGNLQDVDIAQRVAHTLKGSANTVGIRGIANLTHHIEDILLAFAKHQRLPGASLSNTLLAAADVLEMMTESLMGMGPPPEQALSTLQSVLDWANRIDHEGIPRDEDLPVTGASKPAAAPAADNTEAKVVGEAAAMVRVPADMVDDLLRLVGESIILTGQLQNRLSLAEAQTGSVRAQHNLFQQLTAELEHLVETQGLTTTHSGDALQGEFDTLELERYNELHTVTHRLVEAATDAAELTAGVEDHLSNLDELLVDQRKLLKDKQELVMHTRMVPVQTVVPRLQRAVRQAARQTGKQVALDVTGAETMIDSQVLADLVDPLTHLLRNAVDHGVEVAEQRLLAGKAESGHIEIRFKRQGDHVVVSCLDDGTGLDFESIRATAEAGDMLPTDHVVGEEELTRMILLPGFSTRTTTTQVSGRGIGMDAVHSRVNELKGTLHIESEAGRGCRVELQLPLSLISVHALLVPAQDNAIAVSSRGVDQILYPGAGVLVRDGDRLSYHSEDRVYDAWHLESLLQVPVPADAEHAGDRPVLLVRSESAGVCAVSVSGVRATQDMVVKQLGDFVPQLAGIEGTTILGDGSVAPLVDLPALLTAAAHDAVAWIHDHPAARENQESRPCVLVVDDSLSARRSLAEFMQDLGYEVMSARDGLEAIEVMTERVPHLLLVDLEMPRMNGLELAAHVRAEPATRELPMIMITSRSTGKHRQKAQAAGVNAYVTKPFSEDELNDRIQSVLAPEQRHSA